MYVWNKKYMVYKNVTVYILTKCRNIWAKEHSHILFACNSMLRVNAGFFWACHFCFSPDIVTKRWLRKGTGELGLTGKPKVTYILKCENMESPLVNEWDKYMYGHFAQFWESITRPLNHSSSMLPALLKFNSLFNFRNLA